MRGRKVWAGLLLAVAALAAGCADSDAYPNDQARVVETLTDEGLESVSVIASEEWDSDGWWTYVTVSYDTPAAEPSEADLATVRRVVWEQFPHHVETLVVSVDTKGSGKRFEYSGEQLTAVLGEQDNRDDDSEPPLSGGMIAALVIGGVAGLGLITYGVVQSRSARRKPPPSSWSEQPWAPAPTPPPHQVYTPAPAPLPAETPAAPPIEPPAPPIEPRPEPPRTESATPPPARHEPVRPSQRRSFEETQIALNNGWQWLVDQVPDPPEKDRAAYVDDWLAEHSGLPAKRITAARRARNDAIHRPHLITKAAMDEAIAIIDKVADKLHHQKSDESAG